MNLSVEPRFLKAMLSGMVEGIMALDQNDALLFCNRAASHFFGYDDIHSREILESQEAWSPIRGLISHARVAGHPIRQEITWSLHGQEHVFRLNASCFDNGGAQGVVIVIHDMTELRRLETVRQDFVANVSHELKTPLTSIKGYIETLLGGAIFDQKNNVRFLKKIDDNVGRLVNLVQDLLHLARIESQEGILKTEPISLLETVASVFARHEDAARVKGVQFQWERPSSDVYVQGELEGLIQVAENLINNAIKYTPVPGQVTVRVKSSDDMGILEVQDTGIGISAADIDRIFERFYRVDKARSREVGGTGLGLSIVKHLVNAMSGKVQVDSAVGKGSLFRVSIPRAHLQ